MPIIMETSSTDTTKSMMERGIPVVQPSIISLAKLRTKDTSELALLDKAATTTGFFYLDLRGDSEGDRVIAHLPAVYEVVEKYFGQPQEAKAKDARFDIKDSQDLGYKTGYGSETFEISRDEVASADASISHLPQLFQDGWKNITEIRAGCDRACLTLLNSLSADYVVHHRADQPSYTGLKLVLQPSLAKLSDAPDTSHTDSGTLTLVFYKDWSVHALLPDTNLWAFTPPLEGCALVNIANSLQRLSGGRLHSPKHGVTQPFDGAKNRYYLSYFLRPETVLIEKWNADK